jgi:hypothetical protein
MYLYPDLMAELVPIIRTKRIVSYMHPIPNTPCRSIVEGDHTIYVTMEQESWNQFVAVKTWKAF